MAKEQSEAYKEKMAQILEASEMEEKAKKRRLPRSVKFEGEASPIQIYEDWLKKYKEENSDFKENENNFKIDEKGIGWINFSNPEAEEDFARHLAANMSQGSILDKGITIANFKNGKLFDPRTNQEFPEGEYGSLVQKLDSGIAYSDIDLPKPPTPFSTNPNPY